jgi:hypothetical protein
MIIVTANVGLLPFERVEKSRYHRQEDRFFNSARAQLNLRRFHHPGDNRGLNLPGLDGEIENGLSLRFVTPECFVDTGRVFHLSRDPELVSTKCRLFGGFRCILT